jgi:hypothetical protein
MVHLLSWFLIDMMIVFFWNINPCTLVRRYQSLGVTCCLQLQYRELIAVYTHIPVHKVHLYWNPHNTFFFLFQSHWDIITESATAKLEAKAAAECDPQIRFSSIFMQWYDAVSIFRVSIVRDSVSSKPMRCSGSRRWWVQNSAEVRISVCEVSF